MFVPDNLVEMVANFRSIFVSLLEASIIQGTLVNSSYHHLPKPNLDKFPCAAAI